MRPSLELPSGVNVVELQRRCATASLRLADRMPTLRNVGAFGHLADESFSYLTTAIVPVVESYIAALGGDFGRYDELAEAMRAFGTTRARSGVSAMRFNQRIPQLRRALVEALIDDISADSNPSVSFTLYRSFTAYTDALLAHVTTGYAEEQYALAAENESSAATILRSIEAGFALGDLDGRVAYVNDAFERFLGRVQFNSLGMCWTTLLAGTGLEDQIDTVSGTEVWRDVSRTDEFGNERVLRVSLRRVRERLMAVAIDVTHQVEFEQIRREFVRGVMHDIRSPLTLIGGWASTLTDAGDRLDAETRERALQTIHKASNQVAQLTETLLEMDLLDAGEHRFRHVPFPVVARLRAALEATDPDNVKVIADSDGTTAVSDPEAFDRILGNLVDNALTHGEGPVEVRVDCEDGLCVVRVIDAGVCDAERVRAALGGNRVDSSTGFGIGLRACRLLSDALGASLALERAEPTTLALSLPTA